MPVYHKMYSWLQTYSFTSCSEQYSASIDNIKSCNERHFNESETNGRHFAEDIFKCAFFNENILISLKISLKFVPKV